MVLCPQGLISTNAFCLSVMIRVICSHQNGSEKRPQKYPTLDEEANQLLADFQAKFSPDFLASLSGVEMLNTIFLNAANAENVCRVLEFGPQIKDTFGSIKGGNAYKYGLYFSTQGAWMTGSHQKPRQLTEEEAIEVGTKLRDHLVAGAKAIKRIWFSGNY